MKIIFSLFFSLIGFSIFAQTFTEDVAEIIYNKCSVCHRPGEIGPMSFTNYEEVSNWAQTIKFVTSIGYMPPWQADPGYSHFLGENFLTAEEKTLIANWADNGAVQGPTAAEPSFPDFPEGSLLGEPDLVLSFAEAHTHIGNNDDEYRYFVLPTGLTEDKIVKAIEFRPGNTKIVHHALMFEDLTGAAAQNDAETPEYGFEGFGGFGDDMTDLGVLSQKQYPGYVPGQKALFFPDGMGQTMSAGADLVIQVHYAPWPTNETDSSSVNIFFADDNEIVDRYVQDTIMLPFNIAPGGFLGFVNFRLDPEEIQTFHGTYVLEEDLSFIGLSPHMHLIGEDWEVYLEHQDGTRTNMISIPEWDFNWQGNYFFPRLIVGRAGDVVHAFATYDNTSENPNNPTIPPKTVSWGEKTTDEMYYLPLSYVPYQDGDEDIIFDQVLNTDDQIDLSKTILNSISPNPVEDIAQISFDVNHATSFSLDIVDINGVLIRSIRTNEFFTKGKHIVNFKTATLSSGIYFVRLTASGLSQIQKFVKP